MPLGRPIFSQASFSHALTFEHFRVFPRGLGPTLLRPVRRAVKSHYPSQRCLRSNSIDAFISSAKDVNSARITRSTAL